MAEGLELPKNVAAIQAAKLRNGRRTEYRIAGEQGLRLHLYPPTARSRKGRRAWFVHWYRRERGKLVHKAVPLGDATVVSLADACEGRASVLASINQGRDPAAERRAMMEAASTNSGAPGTFGWLFDEWLERHAKKKLGRWLDEQKRYERHLAPPLAKSLIADLERKDVREVRDIVAEQSGPIESNRVVALFNRVMNWAVDEDRAKFNPAARLKKVGDEKRRERVLSTDEIARVWAELDRPLQVDGAKGGLNETDLAASEAMRRALKVLFLTGQRRGEVIGMRKDELDLTDGDAWWSLPGSRTKNGLPHRVPLTSMAVAVIKDAMQASGRSDFVFPSHRTDEAIIPDAVTKALRRICRRMEPRIEGLGPHDIRRTIGQTMRKVGVSVEDRGYVFNHVSGAKAKVTSWNYDPGEHDDEKRAAIKKWERELCRITGSNGAKIIELPRRA
jgi:integrase